MSEVTTALSPLRFVVIQAPTGEIDSYLGNQHTIEFQQGDTVVAQEYVVLDVAEIEALHAIIKGLGEESSEDEILGALSAKIFLAGYQAGIERAKQHR